MKNLSISQAKAAELDLQLADGEQVARVALNTIDGLIYFATTYASVVCASVDDGKVRNRHKSLL
jgi:hypothetical protein